RRRPKRDRAASASRARDRDRHRDALGRRCAARRREARELHRELADVREAILRFAPHAARDCLVELGRHVGPSRAYARRLLLDDRSEELAERIAAERHRAREELEKDHTERPDVAAPVDGARAAETSGSATSSGSAGTGGSSASSTSASASSTATGE